MVTPRDTMRTEEAPPELPEQIETVVFGGGQAGLAIGRELVNQRRPVIVLDAHERVGDVWRARWGSLRLNTPAKYDALPGLPLDQSRSSFPSKNEIADYLERCAVAQGVPVWQNTRVDGVRRSVRCGWRRPSSPRAKRRDRDRLPRHAAASRLCE
jgi:cation diffusion facilitator CzcD-associated flavoprotein CzcO